MNFIVEILDVVSPIEKKHCDLVICEFQDEMLNEYKNHSNGAVIKDTFILPAGGVVRTRFQTHDAAVWFAHCHLDIHKDDGMAFILNVGNYTAPKNEDWLPEDYPPSNTFYMQSKKSNYPSCECFVNEDTVLGRTLTKNHKCSRDHLCHHELSQAANLDLYPYTGGVSLARNSLLPGWTISVTVSCILWIVCLIILHLTGTKKFYKRNAIQDEPSALKFGEDSIRNLETVVGRKKKTRRVTNYDVALNTLSRKIFHEETCRLETLFSAASFHQINSDSPLWKQIKELLREDWRQIRPSCINVLRLVEVTGLSLLTGLIFFNVINDANATDIGESISLLFFSMTLWTFNRMYPAIPSYNKWRNVALISAKDNHYQLIALFVARALTFLAAECK